MKAYTTNTFSVQNYIFIAHSYLNSSLVRVIIHEKNGDFGDGDMVECHVPNDYFKTLGDLMDDIIESYVDCF